MSAENVAVVRSVYESFAKGDVQAALAVLAPEIEWVEPVYDYLPFAGTHVGPEQVMEKVFANVFRHFEEFAILPERFHDAGDVVVVEGRAVGKTRAGGVLDVPAAWVWEVRDGRAVANRNYQDTDGYRRALYPGD